MSIDDTLDIEAQLQDTRRAFDSVAADYDGPLGNNELIQRMRARMWRTLTASFAAGARLLDIGCGTGLAAVHLAGQGYDVVATDWSPRMIERTQARAAGSGLSDWVAAYTLGAQDLMQLRGQSFDGIYSDLGALNCVPGLQAVAEACAALLKPNGRLVVSVIGRVCPWEWVYYAARGDSLRARLRQAAGCVPVSLNHQTVWTQYYTPRDFYRAFADDFRLTHYRGLSLFLPPPYLLRNYRRWRAVYALLGWLDDRLGGWPGLRDMGDHFLMVLTKRA
jgi:2-polyprenyl-3-methyl-5-hydroxy-6-metoxy-1,4-benzoquinol methylase